MLPGRRIIGRHADFPESQAYNREARLSSFSTEALGGRSLLAFSIQRLVCSRHKVFERVLFL